MYDPLIDKQLESNQAYPNSFWASTVDTTTLVTQSLNKDIETDVAIIGGGYAGLSTAFHLKKNFGVTATIVEANGVGWGCSGRNAGFILPLSGRLGYKSIVNRYGMDVAQEYHKQFIEGVETVNELASLSQTDVDIQEPGYLKIAHKPKYFDLLKQNAEYMHKHFGYQVEQLTRETLFEKYCKHEDAYGALRFSQGQGVNPLKLIKAYKILTDQQGIPIYTHSPVEKWSKENTKHVLTCTNGTIKADKIVICSNGYSQQHLHPTINKRSLPVLSSVIVTRPLTKEEIIQSGLLTNQVMMDTRELKYYYRKLPDNRILFGGRGAITGKGADNAKYYQRLLSGLKASFPALSNITIDYQWSGWISVSLDDMPHIYQTSDNVFYSAGYCGAGLSFSTLAGKRLAEKVAGNEQHLHIPTFSTPLPKFPFASFRRVGQWGFYQYGRFKDKWL